MIQTLFRSRGGQVRTGLTAEEIPAALADDEGLVLVILAGETPEVCAPLLRETFGFHPLAVDDALEESHVPKVDDWGTYLYLVLHAVAFEPQGEELLNTLELDLFLGRNYLVTYQIEPIAAVERVWVACQRDVRHLQRGAAHLLYKLVDELVADYMPAVEAMDEAIDDVEDEVFGRQGADLLARIFTLKRALLHLRRIIAPQREALNKLARGEYGVIDEGERIFFRDVYDHLVRLYDLSEGLRDLVSGALDTYLSVVNNRMNEVMKTLTLITTLFMPVSFLVGFFGANFFQPAADLGAWTGPAAFGVFLAALVLVPAGMYLWMRRRAWA